MALVLFVQALYGDGGLLAFGLNFFNMGFLSAILGWGISIMLFKGLKRFQDEKISILIATPVAAFITTIGAAFVLGIELLTIPGLGFEFVYIITGIHAIIALGEAVLTFVILLYFVKAKPKMIAFLKDSDTGRALNIERTQEIIPTLEEAR
jgi:ABC-type Co2+ transport system permease subunit